MRCLSHQYKKGQVQAMAPAIIALIIAAVFLVMGIVMLQEMRDTDIVSTANAATIYNETTAGVMTVDGQRVARAALDPPFGSFTIITITNASDPTVISSGNYTSSSNGTILYVDSTHQGYNNSLWNVSYSYNYGGSAYSSANKTVVGLGTFADFWSIIVLAIVITIVIGLLLIVFGKRSTR